MKLFSSTSSCFFRLFLIIIALPSFSLSFSEIKPEQKKSWTNGIPWKITPKNADSSQFELEFIDNSLEISDTSGSIQQRMPFNREFWQQYDFVFLKNPKYSKENPIRPRFFLSYRFSGISGPERSHTPIETRLGYDSISGNILLIHRIRPYLDGSRAKEIRIPLESDSSFCIENHFSFFPADSFIFESWVNNKLAGKMVVPHPYHCDFFEFVLSNQNSSGSPHFLIKDFLVAYERKHPIPAQPYIDTMRDSTAFPVLRCTEGRSLYNEETLRAAHWSLFKSGDSLPLFDEITADPLRFTKRKMPIELDFGIYMWKVRHQNNFGNWSRWSNTDTLTIKTVKPPFFEIEKLWITEPQHKNELKKIAIDKWYVINLKINPNGRSWNEFGYAIAWLSGQGYTQGHAANKGGSFDSKGNYILNLSRDVIDSQPQIETFEKKMENSFTSERLLRGERGLYFDSDTVLTKLDTVTQTLSFLFKILPAALPGHFRVSAFTAGASELFEINKREIRSNLSTIDIEVLSAKPLPLLSLLLPLLIIFAVATVVITRRRKKTAHPDELPLRNHTDMLRIVAYIRDHLADENLSMVSIRKDLVFSRDYVYELLKSSNIDSMPKLINTLRIEKAQELLKDKRKNISEAGYEVGFSEPRYFSKIFKAYTGKTPSEYKEEFSSINQDR